MLSPSRIENITSSSSHDFLHLSRWQIVDVLLTAMAKDCVAVAAAGNLCCYGGTVEFVLLRQQRGIVFAATASPPAMAPQSIAKEEAMHCGAIVEEEATYRGAIGDRRTAIQVKVSPKLIIRAA